MPTTEGARTPEASDAVRALQAQQLYADYAHAADEGRLRDWADLFADGARFTISGEEFLGPDGAHEFITRHRAEGEPSGSLHVIFNVSVRTDGDCAHGRANFVRFTYAAPTPELLAVGSYRSELTWADGRWHFLTHDTDILWRR